MGKIIEKRWVMNNTNDELQRAIDDLAMGEAVANVPAIEEATVQALDATMGGQPRVESETDFLAVKKAMLFDLFPLMDKISFPVEQKFKIYREMIEITNDKTMVAKAYETAKMLKDDQQKGEALVFLLNALDK